MLKRRWLPPLTAVLVLTLLTAPVVAGKHFWNHDNDMIEGSGDMETRTFDLKDFEVIELLGAMDIVVEFGRSQEVEITLDDNLFDNLELDVSGKTLAIGWEESCSPDGDCRMKITMRKLKAIKIKGAGDFDIRDFDGDTFDYDLYGAGDLDINGKVDDLSITLNGAGGIEGKGLQAKHVKARLNGVGEVEVTATESIDARVSGVGEINYWGKPDKEKTRVGGLGEINRK